MSGAGEALAPGPQRGAEAGGGGLGAPAQEKCDKENTEREISQATNSCFTHGEIQDQSIWGNCSDDELIRTRGSVLLQRSRAQEAAPGWSIEGAGFTQPQRLPQLQTTAQESEEETGKIKNGHPSLSNGNGIHHGAKLVSAENRRLSAPVSQKMHRKIQSSLSVNSDVSKKTKVNAVFSQKTGSSPEEIIFRREGEHESRLKTDKSAEIIWIYN
ncbi:myoD family inhibitor domain-containing protein isoform X3 [Camelus dromedarius]|uniref:myoD family inhibitor domain-containing protein isoform X3 n=1 Tax=Camelus dromedarius TaxID=9838 RepID=UPI0012637D78|nr:myoD family inhibitor domain-containing protein isoform X3 [Camelus dromedarius]